MDWGCNDFVRRSDVLEITAETGALETQGRVKELPAADVRPVIHANWVGETVFSERGLNVHAMRECGNCHKARIVDNFCPNCGADMRRNKNRDFIERK